MSHQQTTPRCVEERKGMTRERLNNIVALTRGPRGISTITGIDRRMIQRWANGDKEIPEKHAATLEAARRSILMARLNRKVTA